jgi:hypothetical protein
MYTQRKITMCHLKHLKTVHYLNNNDNEESEKKLCLFLTFINISLYVNLLNIKSDSELSLVYLILT